MKNKINVNWGEFHIDSPLAYHPKQYDIDDFSALLIYMSKFCLDLRRPKDASESIPMSTERACHMTQELDCMEITQGS